MKTIKLLALLAIFIGFNSCSDNDDDDPTLQIETETVSNLYAPQAGGQGQPISGDYKKFDFSTGETTMSATDWDIAFRGTKIAVNGGVSTGLTDEPARNGNAAAYIASDTFAGIESVNTSLLERKMIFRE